MAMFGSDYIVTGEKVASTGVRRNPKEGKTTASRKDHRVRKHKVIYPVSVKANFRTEVKRIRSG